MAISWGYYSDAAGLNPLATDDLRLVIARDGSLTPADLCVYWMSPAGGTLEDLAAPGTGTIRHTIHDALSGGSAAVSDITLAGTESGLDTATPGADYDTGLTSMSAGTAYPVWIRVTCPATDGEHANLSIRTSDVRETV